MRAWILLLCFSLAPIVGLCQSTSLDTSSGPDHTTVHPEVKELAPAQLSAMLGTPDLYIFDCNEPDMFAEAHVPGAKLIVYDAVSVETLPADHGATLVFYCYSPECPAGTTAARTAISLGFMDVHSMTAGIIGWQDAGLPTQP